MNSKVPVTAVVIPCYNEEMTITKVVKDFRVALPHALIYVFNNASTDATAARAAEAGAIVIHEKRRGKGVVVASILNKVNADYYLMVDGDDTYPASKAPELLAPILKGESDMVVGQRLSSYTDESFRPLHVFGNKLVRGLINVIFGSNLLDVMSGFRAFTRDVADSIPVVAFGFDIETEMTLQLLCRRFVIREVPVDYRERPAGSTSKLRTFRDGALVLLKILGILKAYKPMTFFGGLAIVAFLASVPLWVAVVAEYLQQSAIQSISRSLLGVGLVLLGFISLTVGVVLHTLNFRIFEMTNVLSRQLGRLASREQPPHSP